MNTSVMVDRILLGVGVSPKMLLIAHYDAVAQSRVASEGERNNAREAKEALASMPMDFIKGLASQAGLALWDLIKLFKNSMVVKFFRAIGWSFKELYKLLKRGFDAYKNLQNAIAEYVANTRVVKWTAEELKKLDAWLQRHPKVRRIAGVGVAALLVYIWFNMAFSGDFEYDFDMSDVIKALTGGFSLTELFASPEGIKMLILLAAGAGLGLSFPWPGPQTGQFIFSVVSSIARAVGARLKRAGEVLRGGRRSDFGLQLAQYSSLCSRR